MAAARGIDDLLPTAALAVALATLEETQRRDGLEHEMEENAPRVTLPRRSRKKRDISMYVWLGASYWAQLLENEDLSDPMSCITAKQFRTDFRLLYVPFFLRAILLVRGTKSK